MIPTELTELTAPPEGPAEPECAERAPDVPEFPELPAAQQPDWPDPGALAAAVAELDRAPGLVHPAECDALRARLAAVARGEALLLQGGDCAETFEAAQPDRIDATFRTLGQMAAIVSEASALPVVTVGRIAGQYAKPRSKPQETRGEVTLPVYRGDLVNGHAFNAESRTPDPSRLVRAHRVSAATLEVLRTLAARQNTEFWTSHEALVLDYEHPLTRITPEGPYALSGHLLWVGERTRARDGAHIDFATRIRNPIAVKLGPTATPDEAAALVDRLDPEREPGRLTLVTRMGADAVRDVLPGVVRRLTAEGARVAWICDPMHGNTVTAPDGCKTRRLADILDEIRGWFEVHLEYGTHPGGVHVELTGEHVTECLGGTYEVTTVDLSARYETACDPRLNRGQSLDLAWELSDLYAKYQLSRR
ncbi:3-deoxy-7-phosphoheptulonate synthase [Streptomyces sp. NWU339]|uniref:3-deoxy-7-phosphoheptulonate synthase n=1 Tax=Streptomyces sp. NWU339 TaxID=2185284 RepID=UPI00215AB08D|nr:3-deoxy-7-phosphoheptulonate synthase class II [Streptomyces sp. NWU339]